MELDDAQVKFKLTYHCFSRKINHLLRTVAPSLVMEHLVDPFNKMIEQLMCSILEVQSLTQIQWNQCCLSIDDGGYGVGISAITANAAYLASFLSTLPSIKLAVPSLLEDIRGGNCNLPSVRVFLEAALFVNFDNHDGLALLDAVEGGLSTEKIQAKLLLEYNKRKYEAHLDLIRNDSPKTIAAFTSVATDKASAYLTSRTNLTTLKMTPSQFRIAARQRLRISIQTQDNLKCNCKRKSHIDHYGDHLASCKRGQEVVSIHDSMKQAITDLCRSNGLSVKVEPRNIFGIVDPENDKRPDLLIQGLQEKKIIGDVCVSFPIRNSTTRNKAMIKGHYADLNAKSKHRKYDEEVAEMENSEFIPFIFESRGFWHKEFEVFFEKVIKHGSGVNRIAEDILRTYWTRRLSATLQKAVATTISQKLHRIHAPEFHDESNYQGAVLNEGGIVQDLADRVALIAI